MLARLLDDAELRRTLSVSNRKWVEENYSDKKMFENYGAVFADILGR